MTDSPREETPETDSLIKSLDQAQPYRDLGKALKLVGSLEHRLVEARRENIEHAITQVKATRIIRELDAKLDTALRELAAERESVASWKRIAMAAGAALAEKGKT